MNSMKALQVIVLFMFSFVCSLFAANAYSVGKESCVFGSCVINTSYTRIGIVGGYASLHSDSTQNLALLSFADRSVARHNQKELMQSILMLQAGGISRNAVRLGEFDKRKDKAFALNGRVGLGINLLPNLAYPLYLNALYSFDFLNDTYKIHSGGVELQGFLRGSARVRYEYALGYDYVFAGAYILPQISQVQFDSGYVVRGSVGLSYALNQHIHTYINLYGIYRSLEKVATTSFAFKETQQYIAGVELGLGF